MKTEGKEDLNRERKPWQLLLGIPSVPSSVLFCKSIIIVVGLIPFSQASQAISGRSWGGGWYKDKSVSTQWQRIIILLIAQHNHPKTETVYFRFNEESNQQLKTWRGYRNVTVMSWPLGLSEDNTEFWEWTKL